MATTIIREEIICKILKQNLQLYQLFLQELKHIHLNFSLNEMYVCSITFLNTTEDIFSANIFVILKFHFKIINFKKLKYQLKIRIM